MLHLYAALAEKERRLISEFGLLSSIITLLASEE